MPHNLELGSYVHLEGSVKGATKYNIRLRYHQTDLNCKSTILDALLNLDSPNTIGFLFLHGKNDLYTPSVWNNIHFVLQLVKYKIPIYTAFTNTRVSTLLDRYSSYRFLTATGCGTSMTGSIIQLVKQDSHNIRRIVLKYTIEQEYACKIDKLMKSKNTIYIKYLFTSFFY